MQVEPLNIFTDAGVPMYDQLYEEWKAAIDDKDFKTADTIREAFEYWHGMTITNYGPILELGKTFHFISSWKWELKFGNKKLAETLRTFDSRFKSKQQLYSYGILYRDKSIREKYKNGTK